MEVMFTKWRICTKTALSHYRKCTIFEEIVFHELQTANFVGSCGYKTNYTNRGPGKQCVKVFRLLFGIKRQTMKPRCFVVRNVLPEKVLMQCYCNLFWPSGLHSWLAITSFAATRGNPYHNRVFVCLFVYHFADNIPEWIDTH